MRGRIITSDHRIFELPVLLRWNITYTGGVLPFVCSPLLQY